MVCKRKWIVAVVIVTNNAKAIIKLLRLLLLDAYLIMIYYAAYWFNFKLYLKFKWS